MDGTGLGIVSSDWLCCY